MTVAELLGLIVFIGLFFVARCIKSTQAEHPQQTFAPKGCAQDETD